jgi:[ribosomal protein S5]-alanine N-acetyltransferase
MAQARGAGALLGTRTAVQLRGERCRVRPWRESDIDSLAEHANNINVAKNLRDRFPHPYTRNNARDFLKYAASLQDQSNLAIDVEGAAVGAIGYVAGHDVERFSAEIGYWLGEAFWGRGIATEALVLTTEHAFRNVNILRMFALPFAENAGSVRVLNKAGYIYEGCLRSSSVKFGTPRDQLLYARVNPDWKLPSL